MNTFLMAGMSIVILALASYTIGIFTVQKFKIISKKVLTYLTIGVILDIIATACMIIGSQNHPFTLHGFIGYSALAFMMSDTLLLWNFRNKNGLNCSVSSKLLKYSLFAYGWWVVAFISGALIAMVF